MAQGSYDIFDESSPNKHSALSGNDNLGQLIGENVQEDQRLKNLILHEFKEHTEVDTSGVQVAVKDSFVSLSGKVRSEEAKKFIKALTEQVDGVQDVVSALEVDLNS